MQNRVPVAWEGRAPLPDFAPVPRKYRHDGWTPERQKAFIEALADTGSVTRAAGLVNMAQTNCYALRRSPGAEEFRRAWDAALDFGVQRLKDVAFERAISGEFVPVFIGGSLKGFRRKYNDTLLMFCLRHYGQDAGGKRTTINYFSTRAQAGAVADGGGSGAGEAGAAGTAAAVAAAEISTTTVRTVITGNGSIGGSIGDGEGGGSEADKAARDDALAEQLVDFDGIELDAAARAEIDAALLACAERRRAVDANLASDNVNLAIEQGLVDPDARFVIAPDSDAVDPYRFWEQDAADGLAEERTADPFIKGEAHWRDAGRELSEHEMAMLGFIESSGGEGDVKLMPLAVGEGEEGSGAASDFVAPVKRPPPRNNWDKRKG